ncbi:hypothetical protein ACFU5O_34400 [Streptomyces sp. NPDC057445]|uniref:hypothetical protein n=1 Tax=Streptomyces sp. NPDC057445 TaxID=3346136 RepID=UPI0036B2C394
MHEQLGRAQQRVLVVGEVATRTEKRVRLAQCGRQREPQHLLGSLQLLRSRTRAVGERLRPR